MAGLGADDLGLLEDAQDAEETEPAGRRPSAPRASADDIAMFGSPGASAPKSAPAPKIAGTTGGASAEDLAMFGPSPSADNRPEWLDKKPRASRAPLLASKTLVAGPVPGLSEPGNIDLTNRPNVANADGTHSSVRSMSFSDGGPEILVPTVSEDGRIMSDDEAIDQYRRTGRHLGKFKTPTDATSYADRLHHQQEAAAGTPAYAQPHSLDSLSADIARGKAALNQPTELESAAGALAQPFVDIGKSALRANDFAARAIAHPIDTLASHPGATFREGMRGVNSNIPLANSFVEAIGGPPEYSAEDAAAAPGASDFGSFAGMDPAGKMVGGIAAKTAEAVVPAVARGIKGLAARAAEHDVARAGDKIFEGGTKRSRGGLEKANDKLEEVLRERPAVRAAAMKGDEELGKVSEIYARRGADDVADIYKEADARSVKPPAPKGYALSDHDIMEAESVPEAIDTASEPKTARIENPNFPTRVASPDVGATVPTGRARIIPEEPASQVREVSSRPLGDKFPIVRKYVPADNFQSMEFENIQDPSKTAIVHGSTKTPGKWQTSHFDAEGPSGDRQSGSPAEALKDLLPSQWKPKEPSAAVPGVPAVSTGESTLLFADAQAAESEAAKLTAKAERYGRQADGFVNEELSAKAAKRASLFEIRADEANMRAKSLRTQAEAAKAREALPAEAPIVAPEAAAEPSQAKPGARGSDVVSNMNREIARLMDGDNEARAVAKQLEKIRDEFKDVRGDAIVPSQVLRAEQTAYQKKGYGKAMPGEHEKTATIAANEIASKAVGDVVIKHVTGMDYQAAQAAAKADPSSVAGRLFKANRDIEIANRIQTHLAAKVGQKVPTWADRHLKQFIVHGAAGALGHAASAISPTLGEAVHAAHVAATAAPYASRVFDAAAEQAAPLAERLGEVSIPAPPIPARSTAIANLVKAGRAGATRAQLQAQAKKDGVDPATTERTIAAFSP